jgi:hypothetical protein
MNYIENPEEEIANSAAYGGTTSISPEYEILTNKS